MKKRTCLQKLDKQLKVKRVDDESMVSLVTKASTHTQPRNDFKTRVDDESMVSLVTKASTHTQPVISSCLNQPRRPCMS
jgi:hypothetical protein